MSQQEHIFNSITGTFKIQTTFMNIPIAEIKKMIVDHSKVKKIEELNDRITITWTSDVEWASQSLQYLGYQVFPRPKHLGQEPDPISYELGQ